MLLLPSYLATLGNKLYFFGQGPGTADHSLWESDGTAAGTTELTISGTMANNFVPEHLTTSGNLLYFSGNDAAGLGNLWVSDGTAAGTHEIIAAGANSTGLYPSDPFSSNLMAFDGKLYFQGSDSSGHPNLWVSDGTDAGTTELTVAGANAAGLQPFFMLSFNGKLYFQGTDAAGNHGLWESDGTAAGTTKLNVAGAYAMGLSPIDLTAFGGKLYFDGADASGHTGLWVSDGTAAGTNEIAVAGAGSEGLVPLSFAVVGSPQSAPTGLTLAPGSDSGTLGDGITNVSTPQITGQGTAGDTVTLLDGATAVGTAVVGADGTWSVTASTLADGLHTLTATEADSNADVSPASAALTLTIDTTAPTIDNTPPTVTATPPTVAATPLTVTAALAANPEDNHPAGVTYNQVFDGTGNPNAMVTISDGAGVIGTVQANATGAWSFDPASLSAGSYTLTASETNVAGSTSVSAPVTLIQAVSTIRDTRFSESDNGGAASQFFGSDYSGPLSFLQAQYGYDGTDNVVVAAHVSNAFLYSGLSGEDALAASSGSNVLDGRSGSNWMVGATGSDGGNDPFFVDNRTAQASWSTLLNFHAGDTLTVWDAGAGSPVFGANMGAAGYLGTTLQMKNTSGASDYVTFAGISAANATFTTSTGSSNGLSYVAVTRMT